MEVIPRSHWPAITQCFRSLSYPYVVKSASYVLSGSQIQYSVDYILKSVPRVISFAHKTTCCMLANVIHSSNATSYIRGTLFQPQRRLCHPPALPVHGMAWDGDSFGIKASMPGYVGLCGIPALLRRSCHCDAVLLLQQRRLRRAH